MYWNNGQVIGGTTGAGFYEPEPIDGLGVLGLGAIYAGVYNADVLQAQQMVNDLASLLNYETLTEDGKLGPKTCGFLAYFLNNIDVAELQITAEITGAYNNLYSYISSTPEITTACTQQVSQSQWKTPQRVGPLPTAPAPAPAPAPSADSQQLTTEQINYLCLVNAQNNGVLATCDIPECYALSTQTCDDARAAAAAPPPPAAPTYTPEQIQYLCMAKIAQDGTLAACDVPECYALNPSGCDDLRADAPRCFAMMASQGVLGTCQDPKCYLLNPAGCDAAAQQAALAPPPPPPSAGLTPMPGSNACYIHADGTETCDCYVYAGDTGPHISHYQTALNVALQAAGYAPIPVTGKWDAATCGAQYTLGGSFRYDPATNPYCPYGEDFIYPGDCPSVTMPTRVTTPTLEPTPAPGQKRKISTAALLGGGALLAAIVGGAIYATKAKAGGM